ncbi:MAG: hypothetical protein RLZZ318_1769 [Bacteroidota bacterium]|jgi:heat shock protein HslJ
MKRFCFLLLCLGLTKLWAQDIETRIIYVADAKTACENNGVISSCYKIKTHKDSNWSVFPYEIEGFIYEPGVETKIEMQLVQRFNQTTQTLETTYNYIKTLETINTVLDDPKLLGFCNWKLLNIEQYLKVVPNVRKANASIRFNIDSGFADGFGGCNGFYVPCKYEKGIIHFGIAQSTLLSCSNDDIEKKVMDALKGKAAFYFRNNMLFVVCENLMTLHFRPAKRIDSLIAVLNQPAVVSRGNTFANLGNGTYYVTLDEVQQAAKKDYTFNSKVLSATEKQSYQCILENIEPNDPLKGIYISKKISADKQSYNADLLFKDGSKKRIQIKNVL